MEKRLAFEIAKGLNTQKQDAPMTFEQKRIARKKLARANRKARDQAMRDLGLVKVSGVLGGTYYE